MADIVDIQAAGSTKIIGSDATGTETTPVNSTSNGHILSADISNNGGAQAALSISTTAVQVKAGGSVLSNRKTVTVFNNSNATIYWGYTSGVTTSSGTPIFKNQSVVWDIGPSTDIYLIAASGTNDVRITENA